MEREVVEYERFGGKKVERGEKMDEEIGYRHLESPKGGGRPFSAP